MKSAAVLTVAAVLVFGTAFDIQACSEGKSKEKTKSNQGNHYGQLKSNPGKHYGKFKKKSVRKSVQKRQNKTGDGEVSEQEGGGTKKVAEGRRSEWKKVLIDLFDTDGDGKLSKDEKRVARQYLDEQESQEEKDSPKGNNGVGNGEDPQPPGNPKINDGPGTGRGKPGNKSR